jgi:hypothetical protein
MFFFFALKKVFSKVIIGLNIYVVLGIESENITSSVPKKIPLAFFAFRVIQFWEGETTLLFVFNGEI